MITVIDSIMGSHKTTYFINKMFNTEENYIFVTPFLSQIDKIKQKADDKNIKLEVPESKGSGKLKDLKNIFQKKNPARIILMTHSLFKLIDNECLDMIERDYTLIIDETIDLIDTYEISIEEVDLLKKAEAIKIDKENVIWTEKYKAEKLKLPELKDLASKIKADKIKCYGGNTLIEELHPKIFTKLENIYILTYIFEYSMFSKYLNMHDFYYEKKSIINDKICDYVFEDGRKFRHLINIYTGNLNVNFEQEYSSLSKSWYQKEKNNQWIKQLGNNIYNYFRHVTNSSGKDRMWSTFELAKDKMTRKGMGKNFIACNARATNDYEDRHYLAYCVNKYINPIMGNYLNIHDEDMHDLSQMLQWIWRSAIRKNPPEPIYIYIPSVRMRKNLYEWLGYSYQEIKKMEQNNGDNPNIKSVKIY